MNVKLCRIYSFVLVITMLLMLPAQGVFALVDKNSPDVTVLASVDYEDMNVGDLIKDTNNYDMRVVIDPKDPTNKVNCDKSTQNKVNGYYEAAQFDPNETKNGHFVIEQRIMFNSDRMFYVMFLLKPVSTGASIPLWTIYQNEMFGSSPKRNEWYTVKSAIDVDNGTYGVYIQDSDGYYVYRKTGMKLAETISYPLDCSQGFNDVHMYVEGPTGATGDCMYFDDLTVYKMTAQKFADKVKEEIEIGESKKRFYSEAAQQKLAGKIVCFVDGPWAYVDNKKTLVDSRGNGLSPTVKDGRTLVPFRFVSESLGAQVDYDERTETVTVNYNGTELKLKPYSKIMTKNGQKIELDVAPIIIQDRTMIPIRAVSEALGKEVFYDSGLIVIGDTVTLTAADQTLIKEVIDSRFAITEPGIDPAASSTIDNIEERQLAFEMRDSEENVEKLAKDLAYMLDNTNPMYTDFFNYMETKQYGEALRNFRKVFFDTIKNLDEAYFDNTFGYPELNEIAKTDSVDIKADAFIHNLIPETNDKYVSLGEPGTVDWTYKTDSRENNLYFVSSKPFMWLYTNFDPLWKNYLATGNVSYIKKWADYMDDFCLNQNMPFDLNASDMPDGISYSGMTRELLYKFKIMANKAPGIYESLPETTLARILVKLITYYPANTTVYMRSNPQNWSSEEATDIAVAGLALDKLGFKWGMEIFESGKFKMELYSTKANTLDGSDVEQVVAYDIVLSRGLHYYEDAITRIDPNILSAADLDQLHDTAIGRGTFLMHFVLPSGNYPMGWQSGYNSRLGEQDAIRGYLPEVFNYYDNTAVTNKLRNPDDPNVPAPSIVSEGFPYGGYYFLKDNWTTNGQHGTLYGHTNNVISNMGKNLFVLDAFGRDLLVAGNVGMYDYTVTQHFVDGAHQDLNRAIATWGHRGPMVETNQDALDKRFHDSTSFAMAETEYAGYYRNGVNDVTHERMAEFLKDAGVWVVTDRHMSPSQHTYTVRWTLPIEDTYNNGYKAFNENEISIDSNAKTIRTNQADSANITIFNVGTKGLEYRQSKEDVNQGTYERMSDFYFADISYNSADSHNALVSVIVPRQNKNVDASNFQELGLGGGKVGFSMTAPNGAVVKYGVAANKNSDITIDSIKIQGESLLLSNKDGVTKGMALGISSMKINNRTVNIPCADFEFTVSGNSITNVKPIYKPMEKVEILPLQTSFANSIEVTMQCATPDVEIRYTTDMSYPTLDSTLYTGPFTVTESTVIKARAFRKGLTSTPLTQTGTEMTPIARADLEKVEMKPAVTTGQVEHGLNYNYYQGEWEQEFWSLDGLPVVATGKTDTLFDISSKQTEKGTFSYRYEGYIDVPQDGVYTFWAPDEYMRQNIVAGYELKVFIDGEKWSPTARRFAFGAWSIPLKAGKHTFRVDYNDYRADSVEFYSNHRAVKQIMWTGTVPELMISGPNLPKQVVPNSMLYRDK